MAVQQPLARAVGVLDQLGAPLPRRLDDEVPTVCRFTRPMTYTLEVLRLEITGGVPARTARPSGSGPCLEARGAE
jgi:hypothetical protein